MNDMTDILLRLEQRITNIENFINRYDFDCLPEIRTEKCEHEYPFGIDFKSQSARCIKCGEFYR